MDGLIAWFSNMGNTKPLGLVIFFVAFCSIVIYVYGSKERSKVIEDYKNMPFQDDDDVVHGVRPPSDKQDIKKA